MIANPALRIAYGACLVALVFFVPWWVALLCALAGSILFPWYVEAVLIGLYFDVFFGYPALDWYHAVLHTAVFTVLMLLIQYIKPRINYGKF